MNSSSIILLLPLALLALLFFSNGRRRREAATVQSKLVPGTAIVTTAGLHATIVAVEDTAVVLEIAPGVHTRWARAAVARVVPAAGPDAVDPTGASAPAGVVDDAPGGAVPDDLAALDPDRVDPPSDADRSGRGTGSGSTRAGGPDLTKRDAPGIDDPGGTRP